MENITKRIKVIFLAPAAVFGFFLISSFFGKTLGALSFAQELFFTILHLYIICMPFVFALIIKDKRGRILLLFIGLLFTFAVVAIQASPQMSMARFYYQTKNHISLNRLQPSDVSFIAFDSTVFAQPKEVELIIEALNGSSWYSPNHERTGPEVSMTIYLRDGQEMQFRLSRFSGENSANLLFTRPRNNGYWADGNAYVPKLPSILEDMGYMLPTQ